MSNHFTNKVALVTGSSRGIGKAIAVELCKRGAKVVLNGRNAETLENTRAWFEEQGFDVIAAAADVTNYEACEDLVKLTKHTYGKLDIVIANGGIAGSASMLNFSPDEFKAVVDSNIYGSYFPIKAGLPEIHKNKGSVVFISSLAGLRGIPDHVAYSTGKMALTAMAQGLAVELNHLKVHVGIVYVGFTQNESTKTLLGEGGKLIPVPERPAFLQQSREQVANSVLRLIQKRRFKVVLTPLGKINSLVVRLFPSILQWIFTKVYKVK
jgi:NAD(P)-dependent dehydrogenase (short-subunit alcohol dehydrogenase family)